MPMMARDRFWIHGLVAGATAGVLAEALVLRLNPEVAQPPAEVALGVVLWASWGALIAGVPIALLQLLARHLRRPREGVWPAPGLTAFVYLVASVLAIVNADLHLNQLSATGRRVVLQDGVAWFLGALLALVAGSAVRRLGGATRLKVAFAVVMLVLPAARLIIRPTTSAQPLTVAAQPVGRPARPLVVVGVEGLDASVLLSHAGGGRAPTLQLFTDGGAWGTLQPSEPFLRQSYWTTAATGTSPGAHGVKAHWGWEMPWLVEQPLRLLPWTPQGSRLILPWGLARRVAPPPATVPALWERIRISGVETAVVEWPGFWPPQSGVAEVEAGGARPIADPDLDAALRMALEPFPDQAERVWRAIEGDRAVLDRALDSLALGVGQVWLRLGALAEARQLLEPLKPSHTGEREVVELMVELLDLELEGLLAAAPPDALVVLVSPYGLSPPSPYERLRRLLGIGGDWRTSGDLCRDGVLMIHGRDVAVGRRFQDLSLPDVVPTLCYLLELPVAQYMEGEVVVEAVDEAFLATHPLVVDP